MIGDGRDRPYRLAAVAVVRDDSLYLIVVAVHLPLSGRVQFGTMAGIIDEDCIPLLDAAVHTESGQRVGHSLASRIAFGEHDDLLAGHGQLRLEIFLEVERIGDRAAEGRKASRGVRVDADEEGKQRDLLAGGDATLISFTS